MLPSGGCPGVAPGGYILGGGMGALSRYAGLSVDNVLEMTMVATDGSIVTVLPNGKVFIQKS